MLGLKAKEKVDKNKTAHQMGTITTRQPNSIIAEQFRTVRTNIEFSMIDKSIKTFLITSTRAGAGKSTISANLSSILVSKNKRVLLVDADLRRPSVHKIFGIMNNYGLTNLLTDDQASLNDYLRCDKHSGLYVLTSGAIPFNPAEMLNSNRMKSLINEMKREFDIIIFDMPPVLPVSDVKILSSEVDGVLFVIPYGEIPIEEANKAKVALEKVNANIIGVVINRSKKKSDADSYYY